MDNDIYLGRLFARRQPDQVITGQLIRILCLVGHHPVLGRVVTGQSQLGAQGFFPVVGAFLILGFYREPQT